jgi:hypothetical protein
LVNSSATSPNLSRAREPGHVGRRGRELARSIGFALIELAARGIDALAIGDSPIRQLLWWTKALKDAREAPLSQAA